MMKKASVSKGLKKTESKVNQNRNEGTSRTKVGFTYAGQATTADRKENA